MERSRKALLGWGAALTGVVVLYGPLIIWADNAWTMASPQMLFAVALVEFAIAYLLVLCPLIYVFRSWPLTIALAVILFLVLYRGRFGTTGLVVVIAIGLIAIAAARFSDEATPPRVVGAAALILTVVPISQLIAAHIQDRPSIEMVTPVEPATVGATGEVEDILFLIVDGYPMSYVADTWFGHDTSILGARLGAEGFMSPEISWSHDSFTRFAIPSIVQLTQSIDMDSTAGWRNQKDAYDISRGDNLVAKGLRSAGFSYTHVESGWNGDVCGPVDECRRGHWFNETTNALLSMAMFRPIIENRYGSWYSAGTTTTAESLAELDVWGDGELDYVYAHFMLPHEPYVVDGDCELLPDQPVDETPASIQEQLTCVDGLLLDIIEDIGPDTAVIIAGDHGTDSREERDRDADNWDDNDILERLGAFLAYRLPNGCPQPDMPTNLYAMRAVVACATDMNAPADDPSFVIGGTAFREIEVSELARIEAGLSN